MTENEVTDMNVLFAIFKLYNHNFILIIFIRDLSNVFFQRYFFHSL